MQSKSFYITVKYNDDMKNAEQFSWKFQKYHIKKVLEESSYGIPTKVTVHCIDDKKGSDNGKS